MTADFNLLIALDALLAEGSVARAARRLKLTPSAMSRSLARLRETMGDPLLVRAGRGLVATPRALQLRDQVSGLVQDAEAVLRPVEKLDLGKLSRTFTLRTSDGFVETFGPHLLARAARDAPGVTLRFLQKVDRESVGLRDGSVDLETGVVARTTSPEVRTQALFRDRIVGVVRKSHALAKGKITPLRYASARHVLVARQASPLGPPDEALKKLGLERKVATIVGGFVTALALARASDLVATVPDRYTATLRSGMVTFALPFAMPDLLISMLWHPRLDADPAHRWLRDCVRDACAREKRR
jgi:DNA-binding transcriptional LysR family regulator